MQIWELDEFNKIKPTDCKLSKLKRTVRCIEVGIKPHFWRQVSDESKDKSG